MLEPLNDIASRKRNAEACTDIAVVGNFIQNKRRCENNVTPTSINSNGRIDYTNRLAENNGRIPLGELSNSQLEYEEEEIMEEDGGSSDGIVNKNFVSAQNTHKGRSLSDYCTVPAVRTTSVTAFHAVSLDNCPSLYKTCSNSGMMDVSCGEEPMERDSRCAGCGAVVPFTGKSEMYLMQCSFCTKRFCTQRCICCCELCGGVFCSANCSTLNYSSAFERIVCLDCNQLL